MIDLLKIENPDFIKNLKKKELESLAEDIRKFLIEKINKTGGHLSSNLGVVELTIALHYCFNFPKDKIIFDVSHQSYTHKILTGRAKYFDQLRKTNGLSGYSNPLESNYDFFEAGHSSTSISAQTGFIISNKENDKKDDYVISLIGDASISNGLAFEGLNHLGTFRNQKAIIILNDNKMGINKTTGALSRLLSSFRLNKTYQKIKGGIVKISPKFMRSFFRKITRSIKGLIQYKNIFEDLGFRYIGPIDGNNVMQVINYLKKAKELNQPCILHCITKKGKGYLPAEEDELGDYHGVDVKKNNSNYESFSEIISDSLIKLHEENNLPIYVISSAMLNGTKLDKYQKIYPKHTIDVGISESHAATMSASMAMDGNLVFLSYYSTFSQRAFDQILHDICLQNIKIVIGLDRANLVGEDGKTHQGIYDIAMLSLIPNTVITMPSNQKEAYSLLKYGFTVNNKTMIIRYSKEKIEKNLSIDENYVKPFWKIERKENAEAVIISYGNAVNRIRNLDLNVILVNALFIKPLDYELLYELISLDLPIIVYEEVIEKGSLFEMISAYLSKNHLAFNKLYNMSLPNSFIEFGQVNDLLVKYHLDDQSIIKKINEIKEVR